MRFHPFPRRVAMDAPGLTLSTTLNGKSVLLMPSVYHISKIEGSIS